jgi:fatty acid desaturase
MSTLKMRYPDALLPTTAVLLYVVAMYFGGFALMIHATWWSWLLGMFAVAHAMIVASYLVHECAHGAVFMDARLNERLGRVLLWINGASYGDYAAIKHKHMRHHFDRADVIAIDYRDLLQRSPLLQKSIIALEHLYVPAVDFLMHALVIALPFSDERYRAQRRRVLINLVVRGALLIGLLVYAWPAFLGYLLAYMLFETMLRIMDMHQHTFEVFINLDQPRDAVKFDRDYEQRNTYSNTLGSSVIANLLVLNFGFHNAHHAKPSSPWYRLPAIERDLGDAAQKQKFRFLNILRSYHRHRLARVLNSDQGDGQRAADDGIGFVGVLGVSFLTAI